MVTVNNSDYYNNIPAGRDVYKRQVGRTPNNERRYVNMAVTGIGTYASYTNRYGNTQNAGNKTGRTYKNAHEYKNYLTQKYDCLRSRDYSVNINSSLLSKAMGDEKTKQWLEYNLSLIPESIEKLKAAQSARGCKVLSVTRSEEHTSELQSQR